MHNCDHRIASEGVSTARKLHQKGDAVPALHSLVSLDLIFQNRFWTKMMPPLARRGGRVGPRGSGYRLFPRIDARWTAARLRRASPASASTDGIHLQPRIRPSGPGPDRVFSKLVLANAPRVATTRNPIAKLIIPNSCQNGSCS